jgi:hypothetical protein
MDGDGLGVVSRLMIAVVALVVTGFLALVAIVVMIFVVIEQGRSNQRHIDCIVASAAPVPPDYCVEVIDHLRAEGILRPTTTTSLP